MCEGEAGAGMASERWPESKVGKMTVAWACLRWQQGETDMVIKWQSDSQNHAGWKEKELRSLALPLSPLTPPFLGISLCCFPTHRVAP